MSETKPHPLKKLLAYAKPFRVQIYLASLFSVLNKFFDILPEVLIGVAVDTVVNQQHSFLARLGFHQTEHQLIFLAILTAIIWSGESIFEYLYAIKWRNLSQVLQHKLRLDAYKHIQNADMSYFENTSTGNLIAILNDDINQLERFLDVGANTVIQILSSTILISIIFFILSPKVAALALIPIPLILFCAYYFQRLISPRYAIVRAKAGELAGRFANNLSGIVTIKSYVTENHEIKSLDKQSQEYQDANSNAIAYSSAINPVIRIAILIGFTTTLVYGGLLTIYGELAVGAYSILVFLTQRLLWPLNRIADVTDQFYRAMASTNRVMNLLKTPIKIISGSRKNIKPLRGDIRFENVGFAYSPDRPVLHNINLKISAGQTIAFIGSTGSGKSTLAKLLMRFYDPGSGEIKIDEHTITHLQLNELRQNIGYVSQDIFLFDGTIAENIAYGSFNATREQIENAGKLAEAHEFIMQLPQGYHTKIGERGQKLSGGQRQRLTIARAILKNPPILILDEATSAVDNETEAAIQRSLDKIVLNRTTIIIAHRLSTVRNANVIYVVEKGQIVEQGNHESLLALKGIYADLWALQTGEHSNNKNS